MEDKEPGGFWDPKESFTAPSFSFPPPPDLKLE